MKISPSSVSRGALAALLLAGAALAALTPAAGQQQKDSPESLLPPGFDEPAPGPAPAPAPSQPRAPASAPAPTTGAPAPLPVPAAPSSTAPGNETMADDPPIDLSRYELPEFAQRPLDRVGVVAWGNPAFPANAFGRADGRYLAALMRRLDAPVASRWASIALRRALMSEVNTPRNINGADFAAERAWVLVRMGEANAARAVVQSVDSDNYTVRLYQIAMQAALAAGDPGAMCPIADKAATVVHERGWLLARAMCAGLAGKPQAASDLLKSAQASSGQGDIDNLLAEKVMGTGAQGRRAVTVEWGGITQLTSWRYGLAMATGTAIPDSLIAGAGPQVRYWRALSPGPDPRLRAQDAELAATAGVFSSAGLVDLYGEIEQGDDTSAAEVAIARDLRSAYAAADPGDRLSALKTLWDEPQSARQRYARLILTARAAAAIVPGKDKAADSDRLVSSMLTAGLDGPAMRWRPYVGSGSDGWAMLALADPGRAQVSSGDFGAYRNAASTRKAQLALAGLAGLGKLDPSTAQSAAVSLDVAIGASNAWTRAIDNAGRAGDSGTVALLAAVGMQSRGWDPVTPEALFHICAAMRAAGLEGYARMIAVEAIARAA